MDDTLFTTQCNWTADDLEAAAEKLRNNPTGEEAMAICESLRSPVSLLHWSATKRVANTPES